MTKQVITEYEAFKLYDQSWDENGLVKLGNLTFEPSQIVKQLDPVAYRVGFNDFCDGLTYNDIYVEDYTDDELDNVVEFTVYDGGKSKK